MNILERCPNVALDYARINPNGASMGSLLYQYVSNPGFRALLLYRLAHTLSGHTWHRLASCVHSYCVSSTGCDISPAAEIGPGLLLHHPVGIVIGCGARIGKGCTILQNVTIGEKYSPPDDHSYPQIADNVVIGAGAVLLGAISIGFGAVIAANSVVLIDVPEGAIAVGVPARVKVNRAFVEAQA